MRASAGAHALSEDSRRVSQRPCSSPRGHPENGSDLRVASIDVVPARPWSENARSVGSPHERKLPREST